MSDQTHTAPSMQLWHMWLGWIRTLYPGYFATVMATGIVSIALLLNGDQNLSTVVWGIGYGFLLLFVILYVWRGIMFPHQFLADTLNPAKVFGFFTFIAGLGVLATRSFLGDWRVTPGIMTLAGSIAWLILMYWATCMLLFTNTKPIQRSVNGAWLLAIVATQSLSITWDFSTHFLPHSEPTIQLVAYLLWSVGVLLYVVFITFIMYRFFFHRVQPSDLTAPYWINLGAMAITTVAGTQLLTVPAPSHFILAVNPAVEAVTVILWGWGTWWIPILVIIGIWKYGVRRQPLGYHPALWSMVFPLGMYATSVYLLAELPGLHFLTGIGPICTWTSFGVWALVLAGWMWSAFNALRKAFSSSGDPHSDDGGSGRSATSAGSRKSPEGVRR